MREGDIPDESNRGATDVTGGILKKAGGASRHTEDLIVDDNYFTEEEEKALVKKIDFRVLVYAGILNLFAVLDRANIGSARLAGLEADLNLTPSQYSLCLSVFYISYVFCEVPSNLLLKRFSPSKWISRIMISWGLCTVFTAAVQNFAGLMAIRFFLGLSEAGLFPGLVFYLTFWYTGKEQSLRFALFTSISNLASAFGGVFSYGIIQLSGYANLSGWQWLFIVEGTPTIFLGIFTWFFMPDSPNEAGWLTEREKALAAHRLQNDFREKSMKTFDKQQFLDTFKDPIIWMYMVICFGQATPWASISLLLPTILRDMGFANMNALLLTSPPFILAAIMSISMSYLSDRRHKRSIHVILQPLIGVVGFVLLMVFQDVHALYMAACITAIGTFSYSAISLSWLTNNMVGSTRTATATALGASAGSLGGILAGQLYRAEEAPRYLQSHLINLSMLLLVSASATMLRFYLIRQNNRLNKDPTVELEGKSVLSKFRYTM
ncbi:major facilitator superfamily transporter [Basidiobolus meristosporus CBS 931.73]|uniref:Major facilitator superfamily transporter n=1 Tax=Basidiobolus meristosporus CBS 931.73 TaxID=1314790 RepID=A0A1Y1XQ42_9FUNG|nr:major facilitator superfamily transporter [Basidiobolus meristosporus CBS 931.73]|eukprot:ORX87434.1 major facilitator superfamily transporter [Basidiobolus meristosporus CBS 931.73]